MEGGKRGLGVCWTETVRRKLSCILPSSVLKTLIMLSKPWVKDIVFRTSPSSVSQTLILVTTVVQTLSQGRCFPDQQGRRWQRSRQQRGKEHSSTSSTEQQKVSSILSMIYLSDHHKLWWSIMIVSGHLSAFQVLEPFQSSYLGLPALDFC